MNSRGAPVARPLRVARGRQRHRNRHQVAVQLLAAARRGRSGRHPGLTVLAEWLTVTASMRIVVERNSFGSGRDA